MENTSTFLVKVSNPNGKAKLEECDVKGAIEFYIDDRVYPEFDSFYRVVVVELPDAANNIRKNA